MSNRQAPERSYLDAMTDRPLPGGCDDCDAYQTVTKTSDGVYVLAVHHDPSCPYYRGATR